MAKSALEKQLEDLDQLRKRGVLTEDEYAARRTALVASAGQPVEQPRRGGGIFKWGFFGCLGIFAVIGLLFIGIIVILAAALSGAGDDEPDSGGDVRVSLRQGASGEIAPEGNGSKRSRVTILQIVDGAQGSNSLLQPAAGKKYWAIEVEVQNVGSSEVTSLDWKLRDSQDIEHDREYITGISPDLPIYSDLTPGGRVTGWVVFEIDADARPKWLRADPNPFLAHDLYFDAE